MTKNQMSKAQRVPFPLVGQGEGKAGNTKTLEA